MPLSAIEYKLYLIKARIKNLVLKSHYQYGFIWALEPWHYSCLGKLCVATENVLCQRGKGVGTDFMLIHNFQNLGITSMNTIMPYYRCHFLDTCPSALCYIILQKEWFTVVCINSYFIILYSLLIYCQYINNKYVKSLCKTCQF